MKTSHTDHTERRRNGGWDYIRLVRVDGTGYCPFFSKSFLQSHAVSIYFFASDMLNSYNGRNFQCYGISFMAAFTGDWVFSFNEISC